MSGSSALYWIHALTPLRVGTDEALGAINLPTMREAHTGHPIFPGSSLKGVLRAEVACRDESIARQIFGPKRDQAGDHRGAVSFTDAHLIALPVRSLFGTFAWCTCRFVLERLNRDRVAAGLKALRIPKDPADKAMITMESKLSVGDGAKQVFVEQHTLPVADKSDVTDIALALAGEIWPGDADAQSLFVGRFAVLPDDIFNGLTQTAMEVRTRVCIDPETGTAEESGPWSEEAMPAETLLAGLLVGQATKVFERDDSQDDKRGDTKVEEGKSKRKNVEDLSAAGAIQRLAKAWPHAPLRLGGHNSVGMGRAQLHLVGV